MIVDPDFLDHWRTRMLVDALGGDEMAPLYVMRLWAHCQRRKDDTFKMPTAGLKAQCRCPSDAAAFELAMTDAGFIERDGDTIHVLGWADKNASLLAAWENGNRGGRPKKNPDETHGKPTGNPAVTHGKPTANPSETQTEPIRVDKSREEKNSLKIADPPLRVERPAPPDFDGKNVEALNGKSVVPIATGWELPDDWGIDAEALGWKPGEVLREAERFRQYWVAGKGQGTRRSVKGWRQSWSNWLSKAAEKQR
jgi:hypothetical protein